MPRRFALALALLLSFAVGGQAQTADEIVAKQIAAVGGVDKIKAIQSLRMTGTMTVAPGIVAPAVFEQKRPNKVRVDLDIQGSQNSQGYDGQTAWLFLPVQGMKAAEPAPADMAKDMADDSDIDGPLVDYKAKGNTVELMGKEPVQGTDAYKLKLTAKGGDVRYLYVDAERFLLLKVDARRDVNGTERETSTTYGNYKPVAGVMMAHSVETTIEGLPVSQKVSFEKVEVNVPIEDTRFKMPAAAKQ